MNRITALLLRVSLGAVCICSCTSSDSIPKDDKIQFLSLAWQKQSVAANKKIVAEWNTLNPESQVEYIQGSWSAMNDYLITAFETGDLPDVFQYQSGQVVRFGASGYLANLAPFVSEELRNDIVDVAWETVTRSNGEIIGIPFTLEPLVIVFNKTLFEKAGIEPPSLEEPWTWRDMRKAARKLTIDSDHDGRIDQWGIAIGLRNVGGFLVNLSPGFGGSFIYQEDENYVVRAGDGERKLLKTLKDMLYEEKTLAPAGLGNTMVDLIPGFFNGKYAMFVGQIFVRQQLVEYAAADFRWGSFLIPKSESQFAGTNTQMLCIPKESTKVPESMRFIEFFLNTQNMAQLARGDWLAPTRKSCYLLTEFQSSSEGWDVAIAAVDYLVANPWYEVPGYWEWHTRVASPVFEELFANRITLDEACKRLESESQSVLSRYQKRKDRW